MPVLTQGKLRTSGVGVVSVIGKSAIVGALVLCAILAPGSSTEAVESLGVDGMTGGTTGPAVSATGQQYREERQRFSEAVSALQRGDLAAFDALRATLERYPLRDYLDAERLQHEWSRRTPVAADIDQLTAFEQRTQDGSLTRRLTRTLQRRLAATEQWPAFLGVSQSRLAAQMPCETLKARFETGALKAFDEAALALWVEPRRQPEPCHSVLAELEQRQTPPVPAIWERIYRSMEANEPDYASDMLAYLATQDRRLVKRWIEAASAPQVFLLSGALDADTVLNRRIIADLVVDWSREDTKGAFEHWLTIRDRYLFYKDRYYDTSRAMAMRAAYRRLPEAHEWLRTFAAREDDLELQEWRIRTALWAEDWEAVHRSLAELPPREREEDHWAYWEARALEKLGQGDAARVIYGKLAGLQSYYGFLAADRLQLDYSIYDEPIAPDATLMARLSDEPALIRSREFLSVQLGNEGRREWNNWLSGRTTQEIAAAAVLASQWELHDRAIYTAGLAENRRAISLRFPVLYRTEVAKAAVENSIDPAWIFGVMRRESAYIPDIRSGAGAIGLMQLMPRTAQYVAGLQGNRDWRGDLTDSATNIGFGTYYLRYVMDRFDDHQVLATASYNAGPRRVDQWLRDNTVDADVWIDSIPFTETRRYVRAVLAYAAIYEYHLTGRAQRLSSKLQPIPAASGV